MGWLYKYQDSVADAQTGRPVSGALITVTAQGAGVPTIYLDADGLFPYPDNTVLTDSTGRFEFYVAPGYYYDITATLGSSSGTITAINYASLPFFTGATIKPVAASYTETGTKVLIAADTTGGPFTIIFGSAAIATAGAEWIVKHIGGETLTLSTEGSELIEGMDSVESIIANEVIKISAVAGNLILTTGS